ncbi:P-loop NTPase [Halobaculum litoreum]|uniref:P-loop NTPase n=1 Tax=Halobaculum litoreum TaxID=3031998 RepID=UPI0024C23184|nr:P-loop NTPase [Halobaculum sp. DT92]
MPTADSSGSRGTSADATRRRVAAALRSVDDPQADTDVVASGLVGGVDVDGGSVNVETGLSELDPPAEDRVAAAIRTAVRDVDGVESVTLRTGLTASADATTVDQFDRVIAVASAKGGVGKSTVSAGLAAALAAEADVGLFDADVHGPNAPRLLDADGPVRSTDAGAPRPVAVPGTDGEIELMSVGLLRSETPLAWRGSMVHETVAQLYTETAWTADDTLVIDLPPGTGDVVLTTLDEVPVDGVVVVTTPFHASVVDTNRSVELFRDEGVPVLGAVINMAERECPSCGDRHDLFPEDGVDDLNVPVLAELPFTPSLQRTPDPGDPPEPMAALAAAVDEAAADPWTVDVPEGGVDLRDAPGRERHRLVRERFTDLNAGEPFHLVSDRDPRPVVEFLADLADEPTDAFDVDVERATPDAWILHTQKP